jgi:hypothetical protein
VARGRRLEEGRRSWKRRSAGTRSSASDVLEFAQKQIGYVQVKSPRATGRELTIAKLLGPQRVECVSVPLLIGDERRPDSLGDSPAYRAARLAAIERRRQCFP